MEPGITADIPVIFNGSGECTLEIVIYNSEFDKIMSKHFK